MQGIRAGDNFSDPNFVRHVDTYFHDDVARAYIYYFSGDTWNIFMNFLCISFKNWREYTYYCQSLSV
jgi:hypothetical protein